jgi:hypothetical protein
MSTHKESIPPNCVAGNEAGHAKAIFIAISSQILSI